MLLDLSRIRGESQRVERVFEPAEFAADADTFQVTGPVRLAADLTKDGPRFRLVGRIEAGLECACSRCLETFAVPVAAELDLRFLPASEAAATATSGRTRAGDAEDEDDETAGGGVEADDLGVSFYRDDEIDLVEVVREQFYLALPMKPLCQPECKGLCVVCGVNRNRESCTCKTTWVDPRMDPLRMLRKD